jgi:hypothetical protein
MFSPLWHRNIYIFGLFSLIISMLFGAALISISQSILVANWLLEKNFKEKWAILRHNLVFWIIISLFLLHLIGLLYTDNLSFGIKDVWVKFPLLIIPLVLFSTKPISEKELKILFGVFIASVFFSSIYCYLAYLGFTKKTIIDVRDASVFMSHIRFSLFIAFAIISALYFVPKQRKAYLKIACLIIVLWLLFFLYKLEMATGFISLFFSLSVLLLILSVKKLPKLITFIVFSFSLGIVFLFVFKAKQSLSMFDKLPNHSANILLEKTVNGRYYHHDTLFGVAENGNLVTVNRNLFELEKEWNRLSQIKFDQKDKKGNQIQYTAIRYIASKGFTKDSLGVVSLTKQDIENIENGNSNYKYNLNSGLGYKWREIVWEYNRYLKGENPSGHTLIMRLEFWKTAVYIIKNHLLFGVGTGNIQDAFNEAYIQTNSPLALSWRLRCHNQYLAMGVAYGLFGVLLFITFLLAPIIILKNKLHFLFWPFYLISILSFLTEDTLETQAGVNFFIVFYALFLSRACFKLKEPSEINQKAL